MLWLFTVILNFEVLKALLAAVESWQGVDKKKKRQKINDKYNLLQISLVTEQCKWTHDNKDLNDFYLLKFTIRFGNSSCLCNLQVK